MLIDYSSITVGILDFKLTVNELRITDTNYSSAS